MSKNILTLIILSLSIIVFNAYSQATDPIVISEFIGVNSNVAAYDHNYLEDLAVCTKWIREYHSWGHYEPADEYYKWDNITTHPQGYTWPEHTRFMEDCQKLGINVLACVLNKPGWAGDDPGAYSSGDGSEPLHYIDKLEFMGQMVARYGSKKIDQSLIETADKVTGLNYIRYYEDDNEPDYWWKTPRWPADRYAVYLNAVHDAYGVETSENYPLLGIKTVDSTAMHVMAGLATTDSVYIQKVLDASNGRIPFDVLNIHTYCKDDENGYSPENEMYGLEKSLSGFMEWRNRTLPGIPVWITEFGWDTYKNENHHSYIYAPPLQQANYILRSYMILLHMGFEKAFLFMDKDPNSNNTLQYSSSGLIKDINNGLEKKPSYYFLATMQKILGNARFNQTIHFRKSVNENEVYCLEFKNDSATIYALWTRSKNSATDSGTSLDYSFLSEQAAQNAFVIHPRDNDTDGDTLSLSPSGSFFDLTLTETPRFLIIPNEATGLHLIEPSESSISVYPNPSGGEVRVVVYNPVKQKMKITAWAGDGLKVKVIADQMMDAGNTTFSFHPHYSPGLYYIGLVGEKTKQVKKVMCF